MLIRYESLDPLHYISKRISFIAYVNWPYVIKNSFKTVLDLESKYEKEISDLKANQEEEIAKLKENYEDELLKEKLDGVSFYFSVCFYVNDRSVWANWLD